MIEISNFSFQYREGATPVVQGIDLAIPDGAFVGITGAAGSGKSTLTYALNGIIPHCYRATSTARWSWTGSTPATSR